MEKSGAFSPWPMTRNIRSHTPTRSPWPPGYARLRSTINLRWVLPITDQYVHYLEKAVDSSTEVEWAMRLYNQTNPSRHSRLSFYTFSLASSPGQGNGAYMEYGVSANDATPVEPGGWLFLVGQAERWISDSDSTTGCVFWKQGVSAARTSADKYARYHVHPQDGSGPISIGGINSL